MRALFLGVIVCALYGGAFGQAEVPQQPTQPAQSLPPDASTGNQAPSAPAQPKAEPAKDATTPAPGFGERSPRYQLRAGDVLAISFEFTPDLNQTVSVQPDGFITLREIGDVQVSGLSVPELRETLLKGYSKVLRDPAIGVSLKDFEVPYFTVTGQVSKPGKYSMRGPMTVAEAIGLAGGFTEAAKHSQVVLFRRKSSEWTEARLLNVKEMLSNQNLREDIGLQPGDMVYVPQNRLSKIKRFLPTGSVYVNPAQF